MSERFLPRFVANYIYTCTSTSTLIKLDIFKFTHLPQHVYNFTWTTKSIFAHLHICAFSINTLTCINICFRSINASSSKNPVLHYFFRNLGRIGKIRNAKWTGKTGQNISHFIIRNHSKILCVKHAPSFNFSSRYKKTILNGPFT